jgi:probable addiction module antidote protein
MAFEVDDGTRSSDGFGILKVPNRRLFDDPRARVGLYRGLLRGGGDDAVFIAAAIGDVARAYGVAKLAKETGLTREGLYKTLSQDGNPSFSAILKVLKALGLKLKPEAA